MRVVYILREFAQVDWLGTLKVNGRVSMVPHVRECSLSTVTRVTHVTQFLGSLYKERYRKESKYRVTPVPMRHGTHCPGSLPGSPVHRLCELQPAFGNENGGLVWTAAAVSAHLPCLSSETPYRNTN